MIVKLINTSTVKLLIIGDNLFGEIGKFAKVSRQIKTSPSLDIPVSEIAKLIFAKLPYLKNAK